MWRAINDGGELPRICFSALTLGFFDVAPTRSTPSCRTASFSALTLGFFDVAELAAEVLEESGVSVP